VQKKKNWKKKRKKKMECTAQYIGCGWPFSLLSWKMVNVFTNLFRVFSTEISIVFDLLSTRKGKGKNKRKWRV
jgi:hypothetical protein